MAKINLLPWRAEQKKQQQQQFLTAGFLSIVATLLGVFTVHMYIEGLKEYQNSRNQLLRNEIAQVDKKIAEINTIENKKNQLLTKIDVIQKLQESRPTIVRMFDEVARRTPDGVFLTNLVQVDNRLTFNGKTESNARVSAFMRAIDVSEWLHTPKLNIIQSQQKTTVDQLSDFILIAQLGQVAKQEGGKK